MAGGGEGHIPVSASVAEKARGRLLCTRGRAQTPPLSLISFVLVLGFFQPSQAVSRWLWRLETAKIAPKAWGFETPKAGRRGHESTYPGSHSLLIRASNFVFFDLFPIDIYSKQEKKIKSHIGIKK